MFRGNYFKKPIVIGFFIRFLQNPMNPAFIGKGYDFCSYAYTCFIKKLEFCA